MERFAQLGKSCAPFARGDWNAALDRVNQHGRQPKLAPADVKEGSGCVLCFYCTAAGNHARRIYFQLFSVAIHHFG